MPGNLYSGIPGIIFFILPFQLYRVSYFFQVGSFLVLLVIPCYSSYLSNLVSFQLLSSALFSVEGRRGRGVGGKGRMVTFESRASGSKLEVAGGGQAAASVRE